MKNKYAHIVFGLVALSLLLFIIFRDDSDPTVPTATAATTTQVEATPATASTPTTPATETTRTAQAPGATIPPPATTAEATPEDSTTDTTVSQETPVAMNQPATAYVEALAGFKETLAELVTEINTAGAAWDNRGETGATYRQIESALINIGERAQALAEAVGVQQVPAVLRSRHSGPGGPADTAAALAPRAEAVLAGLRIPVPDDGSTRRTALADFNAAADDFNVSADNTLRFVNENAGTLGLTVSASATTTTTASPPVELSDEAIVYITGLTGFKETLAESVTSSNAASLAWDNRRETGATYRETDAALSGIVDHARVFHGQVRDHPVPGTIGALGQGPIDRAARLAPLAEAVLEGLRIPAPEDGSARRAALADFNAAADDFNRSVDGVIRRIEENAEALGLVKSG